MMKNIETHSPNPPIEPGYTEWSTHGSKLIAKGDLLLSQEQAPIKPETSRRIGERALNPWQQPGYIPGGASPNSLREISESVQRAQESGAYDREVLEARAAIGRFERKEK